MNNYPTTCIDRNACYISYALIGTAPNRSFVVTWNNVPEWVNYTQTAGNFNLQIILQENGEFIYQYGATNYRQYVGRAQIGWQVDQQDYEVSQVGLPPSGTAFGTTFRGRWRNTGWSSQVGPAFPAKSLIPAVMCGMRQEQAP